MKAKIGLITITTLTLCVFAVFALRAVQLTLIKGDQLHAVAQDAVMFRYVVDSERGQIMDRNGVPLVQNELSFNILLERAFLPPDSLNEVLYQLILIAEAERFFPEVSPVTAQEQDALIEKYELQSYPEDYRLTLCGIRKRMEEMEYSYITPYVFAQDIPQNLLHRVSENSYILPGVSIQEASTRVVSDGDLMPHILGSVGPIYAEEYEQLSEQGYELDDTLGRDGIEKAFEQQLKGSEGEWVVERSRSGDMQTQTIIEPVQPGDTVTLTIDSRLQQATTDALQQVIGRLNDQVGNVYAGAVVVMDVHTGDILAAVTEPSYDLNLYNLQYETLANDPQNPLFNRAFSGLYRPGSVFKPLVGVTALYNGVVSPIDTVYCSGSYHHYSDVGFTPGCTGVHRSVNMHRALQYSCNVYFYEMGRRLGIYGFSDVALAMGLGQQTGLEIPEATGLLSTPENREAKGEDWFVGDVVQAAIGQGDISVTPVQMAVYAATLATNGRVPTAQLVTHSQPQLKNTVMLDSPAYETIKDGMVAASSTFQAADYLAQLPYAVATKTGTPQAANGNYDATIIAFGPADNPEIAIAAVVENGANGYELGELVAEVFLAYDNTKSYPAVLPQYNIVS